MKYILTALVILSTQAFANDAGECRQLFRSSNQTMNSLEEQTKIISEQVDRAAKGSKSNPANFRRNLANSSKSLQNIKRQYAEVVKMSSRAGRLCSGRSKKAKKFVKEARDAMAGIDRQIGFIQKTLSYL